MSHKAARRARMAAGSAADLNLIRGSLLVASSSRKVEESDEQLDNENAVPVANGDMGSNIQHLSGIRF